MIEPVDCSEICGVYSTVKINKQPNKRCFAIQKQGKKRTLVHIFC